MGGGTLEELLAVHARTVAQQRIGDAEHSRAVLARIEGAASGRAARTILVARDGDGNAHAGAYVIHDSRYSYYLLGGSDAELRGSGAMSAVIWAAIEDAARRRTGFDFEGSMLPGVERFFRAFGGVPQAVSRVRRIGSRGLRAELAAKRSLKRALGR